MVTYKTTVNIKEKSPEEVFNWWMNLNHDRYTNWHKEHLFRNWQIKDNKKNKLGAKVKFGEKINGYIIKFNGKISALKPNELIQFKHAFFPVTVYFIIKPADNGCSFYYELNIGFNGLFGKFFDLIIYRFFPKDKFGKSLIQHVHEENTSIP